MNKKLIALAVAGAALSASANAANIYDDGKSAFNIKGEIDTFLATAESGDIKADLDISNWVKLQADMSHKVTETVTVFGSFEIENGNGYGLDSDEVDGLSKDSNGFKSDDAYFGVNFGENYGVAFGEIGDFGHSVGLVAIDNTNEGFGYVDDFAWNFESAGHTAAFKANHDALTVVAEAYLSNDEDVDTAYGIGAKYDFGDFNVAAAYQNSGNRVDAYSATVEGDNTLFVVKGGYSVAGFDIAANYVLETENDEDITAYGVAASYSIDALRLYTTVSAAEKDDADEDLSMATFGADYAVLANLSVFAEYAQKENTGFVENDYNQTVVGAYYTF